MITSALEREKILARAYEQALCSPFARGVQLGDVLFDIEQLREAVPHFTKMTIPPVFADDAETIFELHFSDLSTIAGLFTQDASRDHTTPSPSPETLSSFAHTSLNFHEALLHATSALFSLSRPEIAATLMHGTFSPSGERSASLVENLLRTGEELRMTARRLRHAQLTHMIETGSRTQIVAFFTHGHELGIDSHFFAHHLDQLDGKIF